MNRVWDYIGFAVWFVGLGYTAMWLVGSSHHLMLSPALHWLGVAAAMLVPVRLLLHAISRRRAAPPVPPRTPAAVLRPSRRKSTYPIRQVKPRSHFGLRGLPG